MQQAQWLFFSGQLTEFHTLHTIQSHTFQKHSLALVLLLLFHHCIPAKTTADSEMFAEPSVLINICCKDVAKIPLSLTDSHKPENLINTEH